MATATALTWADLCRLEPDLLRLERMVKARGENGKRKRTWCANAAWYGYGDYYGLSLKEQMSFMVGFLRRDKDLPELCTSEAYMTAYGHLYELLPSCKRCGCL